MGLFGFLKRKEENEEQIRIFDAEATIEAFLQKKREKQ